MASMAAHPLASLQGASQMLRADRASSLSPPHSEPALSPNVSSLARHSAPNTPSPTASPSPPRAAEPTARALAAALSSPASGSESDEPLSPEFAHAMSGAAASERVLRAWSPRTAARRAARANAAGSPPSAPLAAPKRARADHDASKENEFALLDDSDSDGDDGYARGTVFFDDDDDDAHEDEDDDLFLTPRRAPRSTSARGRASPSQVSPGADEYATFDPILALLDDHWAVLRLGDADSRDEDAYPTDDDLPAHLAPLSEDLQARLRGDDDGTGRRASRELQDTERELMEALRDADALEASRERYAEECKALRTAASTTEAKTRRLQRENLAAAAEIAALNEAMATLTAAHDVDARINELLIDDQAEEIRDLRAKLAAAVQGIRPRRDSNPSSATSSITGELTDSDTDVSPHAPPFHAKPTRNGDDGVAAARRVEATRSVASCKTRKGMKAACRTAARAKSHARSGSGALRAKERAKLIERKASLFKEYEKRHSMTIQHVVRRSSQHLIARRGSRLLTPDKKREEDEEEEDGNATSSSLSP